MGYLQFISNLISTFMQGASFAIGQGEPYGAIINIQAANAVLPPSGNDPDTGELIQGYAVDLEPVLPKITPRKTHDQMYMTESIEQDVQQWIAINKALQMVAQAISRYAHDNKAAWGNA